MTPRSQELLDRWQVRKTPRQKEAFRLWLCGVLEEAGYTPQVEQGRGNCRNILAGDPEKAKLLLTAHYDTQPVLPFPNFITPRNLLFYIFYQLLLVLPLFLGAFVISFTAAVLEAPIQVSIALSYALCIFFVWWLFFGKANKHTANDNTSGVITLLETALSLPETDRSKVCFVFFDNEEKGMLGSAAFAKKHRQAQKDALVLNFDCVSDGDYIQFFPSKALKKEEITLERLEKAVQSRGEKQVEVVRSFGFYPSDNARFRRACGVCALKKGKAVGYYMDRIHTNKDVIFEEENITLLRDGILNLIHTMKGEE